MKSLIALENTDNSLSETLSVAKFSNTFVSKETDKTVNSLTLAIKKELKIDYSKTLKFKPSEKERLQQIYVNYLTGKSDDFNSHYIQLLAWHIQDFKIIKKKIAKDKFVYESVFEYSPNPLSLFTVIEKTFKLFKKQRIDVDKISYALILNYLNNYKIVSNRYKTVLKKYLSWIKFSEDLDVYFNIKNVMNYVFNKTLKLVSPSEPFPQYPERLLLLKIRPRTLDTIYFSDAWFEWMFKVANLTSDYVLKNLNCSYFKICNEDKQKIIIAKIIYDNAKNYILRVDLEQICLSYLFPCIKKGNPFKQEFWNLKYEGIYKICLDAAWNFIEQTFVNNSKYEHMISFEE